tara:strand:+ start:1379 stop:2494 length:1116 start_codon:yes stop_codon:yes gene_type:complete
LINKYLVPAGFKDSLNFDTYIEHHYKNLIINSFIENGFNLIKTPLLEFCNNLDSNTLLIKTNKKSQRLGIRNDITPQIIRISSSRLLNKQRPLKLCYYGEVVRKSGSILRPERQFQQVGAEIIGSESYKADVEIINLAYETLKIIGVKNIVIEISAPFFLNNLLSKIKDVKLRNKIKKYIALKDLNSCIRLLKSKELIKIFKTLYSCTGPIKIKKTNIEQISRLLGYPEESKRLLNIAKLIQISKNDSINLDLFEIHKNNKYYQGIKFTFFAKNVRGEIAGGGRYIIKYKDTIETAIGYTCYMDTILRASSFTNKNKKILIPFQTDKKTQSLLIKRGYTLFKNFDGNNNLKIQTKKFGIKYYLQNKIVKKI